MRFLSNVLATLVGLVLFFFLTFFSIVIFGAIMGSGDDGEVTLEKNSVLELDLSKVTLDYTGEFKPSPFQGFLDKDKAASVTEVINAIVAAKDEEKIKGISILKNYSELGMAQCKEIRNALEDFKASGKFIVAYANNYSQKEYYLASVANEIYLNPLGEVNFRGLSAEVIYMKELQEKAGVKMEILRHGKYKSAVEPYLLQEMSNENREQLTVLLQSVWSTIVSDISTSRKIEIAQLDSIANQLNGRNAKLALANKLIDKIAYEDEFHEMLNKKLGVKDEKDKKKEYNKIAIADYAKTAPSSLTNFSADNTIAVIYAQGEIQSGEGSVNIIGEGAIKKALQEARNNKDIKAVVLRVNSPGGNALTSELIWRELELTKKKKPVVVSMGNYAASGGYYISCNANTIFAENNTITGSIGVFGMLPNMNQLGKNIGINAEQVATHNNSNGYSVFEPLDEQTKNYYLEGIETIYSTFLQRVATGRKMTTEQVDAIAQGRVWTGVDAQKIGLVDKIGGLDDAIKHAATLAKIKEYRTENFPEYESSFDDVINNLSGVSVFLSKEAILKEELGAESYLVLEQIRKMQQQKGIQARMPMELNIK